TAGMANHAMEQPCSAKQIMQPRSSTGTSSSDLIKLFIRFCPDSSSPTSSPLPFRFMFQATTREIWRIHPALACSSRFNLTISKKLGPIPYMCMYSRLVHMYQAIRSHKDLASYVLFVSKSSRSLAQNKSFLRKYLRFRPEPENSETPHIER